MKVTLVHPPLHLRDPKALPAVQPPIGLAYVAASLRAEGHEVLAVDGLGEAIGRVTALGDGFFVHGLLPDEIAERIDADSDVVGVSTMFSSLWPISRAVVQAIHRRLPHATLVCGGEHVTHCTELVLGETRARYAVLGEGEETVCELFAALAGTPGAPPLEEIAGLARRDASGRTVVNPKRKRRRTLDAIPWPAWDLFPVERYVDAGLFASMPFDPAQRPMVILGSRGCPYTCKFCSNENMWGTQYFTRDPADIVDEMESYLRRYGANDFHFLDLTPIINRRWAKALCRELIDRDLGVTWKTAAGTRSEALDRELLQLMARSGCDELILAPESGSRRVLQVTRKRIDLENVLDVVRMVRDDRIPITVSAFMVIGFPEERLRDVLETYRYLLRMVWAGFSIVFLNRFAAYPGSEYYADALREGRVELRDAYFLDLDRNFDFRASVLSWHPRWSSGFVHALRVTGYLTFYGAYYLLRPVTAVRAAWRVLRNRPRSRFERFFSFRMWQSSPTLEVRVRDD
jgi:radical SAM superfamily enzyme YgiQ (UPF0313 family)